MKLETFAHRLRLDNVIEISITFLGDVDGIVVLWENVLVLRKYRLKSLGVKCHAAYNFGMIHKIKMCECVGIVREEANAAKY